MLFKFRMQFFIFIFSLLVFCQSSFSVKLSRKIREDRTILSDSTEIETEVKGKLITCEENAAHQDTLCVFIETFFIDKTHSFNCHEKFLPIFYNKENKKYQPDKPNDLTNKKHHIYRKSGYLSSNKVHDHNFIMNKQEIGSICQEIKQYFSLIILFLKKK